MMNCDTRSKDTMIALINKELDACFYELVNGVRLGSDSAVPGSFESIKQGLDTEYRAIGISNVVYTDLIKLSIPELNIIHKTCKTVMDCISGIPIESVKDTALKINPGLSAKIMAIAQKIYTLSGGYATTGSQQDTSIQSSAIFTWQISEALKSKDAFRKSFDDSEVKIHVMAQNDLTKFTLWTVLKRMVAVGLIDELPQQTHTPTPPHTPRPPPPPP
jgi:hypothetical protein